MVLHRTPDWNFPAATFTVNMVGCLVAGTLWGLAEKHGVFSASVRLFLFTGLLGGFTTFSAFGLETVSLIQRKELMIAGLYVALSVACGVATIMTAVAIVPSPLATQP